MGFYRGPRIISDGLVLHLDVGSYKSYPGSGTTVLDMSGNNHHFTMNGSHINNKLYELGDSKLMTCNTAISTSTTSTLVVWIKTATVQSLFWDNASNAYLGAYRTGNKGYHSNIGSPVYYVDTVDVSKNLFDNVPDNNWHMVEFKNCDFSSWIRHDFNGYNGYDFQDGVTSKILMYDRNLTTEESLKNYNSFKSRYQ